VDLAKVGVRKLVKPMTCELSMGQAFHYPRDTDALTSS
jgi:hypothetical protein